MGVKKAPNRVLKITGDKCYSIVGCAWYGAVRVEHSNVVICIPLFRKPLEAVEPKKTGTRMRELLRHFRYAVAAIDAEFKIREGRVSYCLCDSIVKREPVITYDW